MRKAQQIEVSSEAILEDLRPGDLDDPTHEVATDVAYRRHAIVNVVYYGEPGGPWVLIDAGTSPFCAAKIRQVAEERFDRTAPQAIVMTHGHFDHVAALEELADEWQVPVYAHPLEFPYLSGESAYPPPDPSVGGGMVSVSSKLFPRGPVDVKRYLQPLNGDGTIAEMPGWGWIHVPGHTPGQIALWREADRLLISADAVITTAQESAYAVMTQEAELHGPPKYFTTDWRAAGESVRRLADLEPEVLLSMHGRPLAGPYMRAALQSLATRFEEVAVPEHGQYVEHPARPEDGTAYAG